MNITDDMVEVGDEAAKVAFADLSAMDKVLAGDEARHRVMRAALEAVAPMIRAAALEEAARTLETMSFLLSIGSPEEGPFTRQDRVRDEVIEQGATAIRALKERADKLDKLDKLDKIGETDR